MVKQKTKKLKRANWVDWCIAIFFFLLISISILPMMNIFSLSISDDYATIADPGMMLPMAGHISFVAYGAVFSSQAVYTSFLVSLLVCALATIIHISVTTLTGFVLSNRKLPGRNVMMMFILITMLFGGGLVPTYLVISSYGMLDTIWVMVLPGAISGYSIILMKNFIINIPTSLIEAAEIDGASPIYVLIKIIVPLSIPIIATLALFCAVGKWNDWMSGYLYIKKNRWLWPFQNVLQNLIVNSDSNNSWGMNLSEYGEAYKNALIIISLLPVVLMYLFAQKYLIKGIFIGSVKE